VNAFPSIVGRLGASLIAERERWALWLPVCLGVGIALYFALPAEPPLWLGLAALAIPIIVSAISRHRPAVLMAAVMMAAVAGGFTVSQWRTVLVAAPMLTERLGPTAVTGRVVSIEAHSGKRQRIVLERPRIARLGPERTPEQVRVSVAGKQPTMRPGDWIRVRAVLMPPPAPAAPGAFDFQRQSFFRQLGAVGFVMGKAEMAAAAGTDGVASPRLTLARVRQNLTERVLAGLEGTRGAVAAALMTGRRGAIPADLMSAIRDSGLAHLLAISGLHIGLVAATLFAGLRAVLALVPAVALRYPIKKWAAAAAIAGALAYALASGATVPTQRAFLMVGLVLLAVMLDRRGISMRSVAWAATIILLLRPESLLGASFQLSFAAVVALVATYEVVRERRRLGDVLPVLPRRVLLYVGGVALTTLIAGTATAPFAVFHFNRVAVFGLAANLAAVPVTALWTMPWAVAAFLLMPFGLEALALTPMGWGIEVVVRVAETVAAWPGAVTVLPAMPTWGLAAVTLGGLWLCLWRRRWRLWGVAGVIGGMAAMGLVRPPDVLVDGGGKLLAVRSANGALSVSTRRAARFSRETWLRRAGQDGDAVRWPSEGFDAGKRLSCDDLGCIYRTGGHVVALVNRPEALAEDCWTADIVVSLVPVWKDCPAAITVIDRGDLRREGGHALWLEGGAVRIESVDSHRGSRPWVVRPPQRRGGY
jgi:competence protein ComEC